MTTEEDFITNLTRNIAEATKCYPSWAESCALATLAPALSKTYLYDEMGRVYASRNIFMGVGISGITKTLPIFTWTVPIVQKFGKLIGKDTILPNRSSVQGFIEYTSMTTKEGIFYHNCGLLPRDEFSGLFGELRRAQWQTDGMEFISETYDGNYQKRYTVAGKLKEVPELHVTYLTATTPYFVQQVDRNFFIQGTGNRPLFNYLDIADYKQLDIDSMTFFARGLSENHRTKQAKYAENMAELYKNLPEQILMDIDAGESWNKFRLEKEQEWLNRATKASPTDWDYQIIKRLPHKVLKLALEYAVSRQYQYIMKISVPFDYERNILQIEPEDVQRAIEKVEQYHTEFRKIVLLKRQLTKEAEITSDFEIVEQAVLALLEAPNSMLNWTQWFGAQTVSRNTNTFNAIKIKAIQRGLVREVDQNEITDPNERQRLRLSSASKVYTPTKDFINSHKIAGEAK